MQERQQHLLDRMRVPTVVAAAVDVTEIVQGTHEDVARRHRLQLIVIERVAVLFDELDAVEVGQAHATAEGIVGCQWFGGFQ